MLYPQSNPYRQLFDLSGFWDFAFDPNGNGMSTLDKARPIAVPASWNDQFEDGRDYIGPSWYRTQFDLPWGWDGKQVRLRFGSVNYIAEVWLNGVRLGQHEGGHLPFEFDVTSHLRREGNTLVVRVEGSLAPDRVPPGNIPAEWTASKEVKFPATAFDFFPFCGIHRPALLYATTPDSIADLAVSTDIAGSQGRVRVQASRAASGEVTARLTLAGHGAHITAQVPLAENAHVELSVPDAALWSPDSPNLYDLTVELIRDGTLFDRYTLPVGIRTIKIEGDRLLLNGRPIYLTGLARHEDFPITGRGLVPAVIVKDYALLGWMHANSFRTSHYPYSEQMMDLADRLGFLVIDETPAVGLFFDEQGLQRRLELCRQYTSELIARDKNHPCVIMWSLANEPKSEHPNAKAFFRSLYDLAKSLDATRPVTLVSNQGVKEEAFEFLDLLCLNRYYGWYREVGQIEQGAAKLSEELDALYARFRKPLLFAEFGADALPGHHAQPPEMFSEEYQTELILRDIEVLRGKPFVIGEHVWNMCDFKTAQSVRRMGSMNYKGVFTRDRRPKLAAHRLREAWGGLASREGQA